LKYSEDITGIILCGGKSIRMGVNKAFIQIEGVPIITRIYDLFKALFREVIIVTNEKDLFSDFDSKICSDLIPGKGALGGLYTGILSSSFQYCFCVACDMPFIQKPLVQYLIENIDDADVVVPQTKDGLEPLHAIYSKNCVKPIRKMIDEGKSKIVDIYDQVKVKIVDEKDFLRFDPGGESFINVNTPEELRSIRKNRRS